MSETGWFLPSLLIFAIVTLSIAVKIIIKYAGKKYGINTGELEEVISKGAEEAVEEIKKDNSKTNNY
jgi:hypothetical protein